MEGLSFSEISDLVDRMDKVVFKKDDVILKQGDPADSFYIIYDGKVKIVHKKTFFRKVHVTVLGPEDYFGEIAFLTFKPRKATVIALHDTVCFVLSKSVFMSLVDKNPTFKQRLRKLAFRRSLELKRI